MIKLDGQTLEQLAVSDLRSEARTVSGQAEQARLFVAGLGLRRNGPDFGESEPQRRPGRQRDTLLVQSCAEADRVAERQAECLLPQP